MINRTGLFRSGRLTNPGTPCVSDTAGMPMIVANPQHQPLTRGARSEARVYVSGIRLYITDARFGLQGFRV